MGMKDLGALLGDAGDAGARADAASAQAVILIVDDDVGVLEALGEVLSKQHRVILRSSAADGVAALDGDVSVVILDVKMRELNGFWACEEIRKKNPYVPVIFYSAFQDVKDPMDIINEHRPFAYITKGTSMRSLLSTVERAISYYRVIADDMRLAAELAADGGADEPDPDGGARGETPGE